MGIFLMAPILSFFSRRLYAGLHRSNAWRGLAYLAYLTFLFCALAVFLCQFLLLPLTTSVTEWLIHATPEIQLTASGLELMNSRANAKVTQPYLVRHPAVGVVYSIDTTKTTAAELLADQSKTFILIGKQHIVIRNPRRSEARVFDLNEAMAQVAKANQPIPITKSVMRELAKRLQGFIIPFALLLFAPIFFVWKLLAALFYSLIAFVFNLFRKEKLDYGSLFTIACFALSPVTVLQWLSFSAPYAHIRLSMIIAFGLTVAYLIYALLASSLNSRS